jgi:hypothetical protein
MKLLMFYAHDFWFRPHAKTLEEAPEAEGEDGRSEAVVIFYQAESEDQGREKKVATKWLKNAKWLAGKFGTQRVVLHSFGHLSSSKASVETARAMTADVRERLESAGYEVLETPFGYLHEWKMHVTGESLGRVFKEI